MGPERLCRAAPSLAAQSDARLESALAGLLPEARKDLGRLLAEARERGIPTATLVEKASEEVAKRAPVPMFLAGACDPSSQHE